MSESNPEKKRKKTPTADGVARLTSLRRQVIGALILFLFAFFLWTRVETSSPPELSATKIEIPPRPILPATIPVEVDLPPIESSNFEPEFELESESESRTRIRIRSGRRERRSCFRASRRRFAYFRFGARGRIGIRRRIPRRRGE